jgi:hypothetical protein
MSFATRVAALREARVRQFHDNQTMAGEEIISHFMGGTRYVLLAAQMQSGKTGCALYVAFQMLLTNQIEKVLIISGGSETELREQWANKLPSHFIEFSDDRRLTDDEERRVFDNIEIVWRQDLKKSTEKFNEKYLIIWDESHFASSQNQTLHQVFTEIGLMGAIQGDIASLTEKNSYVLSITATRDAEQARAVGANDGCNAVEGWAMVVMHPGNSYRGVVEFKREGCIMESCKINDETKERFISILQKYLKHSKYMVLRCSCKHDQILEEVKAELGIDIVHYNSETKGEESHEVSLSLLEKAPPKFTLFVVKGMLRMGKELPKKHICAVFESSEKSKHHTILQGLLGRSCGYHSEKIDIYLPKDFIASGRGLDEYEAVVESNFQIAITGTQHTPRRGVLPKASKGRITNPPHRIRPDVDVFTVTTCNLSKTDGIDVVFDELIQWWMDGTIDKKNYSFEQQTEILMLLTTPDKDSIAFSNTHTRGEIGIKLKDTDESLRGLEIAIKGEKGIPRGRWTPIIVWNINGNCPGTMFKKEDCVIIFNTIAKPDNYRAVLGPDVCPTNDTDIHHAGPFVAKGDATIDVPGGQLCWLKPATYTDVELFKDSLREAIGDSVNPEKIMCVGKQLTSNYWKGGKKFKGISFSSECYTIQVLKQMFIDIGTEHGVFIEMKFARGRKPLDSGDDIRIQKIYWQ